MKRIKSFFGIVFSLMCIVPLAGCPGWRGYKGYTGDYPELYTVALYSIPPVYGSMMIYEIIIEPVVCYLEEDEYGRVLFCYAEDWSGTTELDDGGGVYLVICQGHDSEYAYYYSGANYICSQLCEGNMVEEYGYAKPPEIKDPYNDFTEEQIAKLKEENDWGKELDLDKCTKAKICRRNEDKFPRGEE